MLREISCFSSYKQIIMLDCHSSSDKLEPQRAHYSQPIILPWEINDGISLNEYLPLAPCLVQYSVDICKLWLSFSYGSIIFLFFRFLQLKFTSCHIFIYFQIKAYSFFTLVNSHPSSLPPLLVLNNFTTE